MSKIELTTAAIATRRGIAGTLPTYDIVESMPVTITDGRIKLYNGKFYRGLDDGRIELVVPETVFPKSPVLHPASAASPAIERTPATVSFIFDRQQKEIIDAAGRGGGFPAGGFKSVFDSKGIKFSVSLVNVAWDSNPNFGGTQMTQAEMITLQSEGHEIQSHIRALDQINANYDEAYNVIKTIKEKHEELGFKVNNGNWLGGASSPAYRSAVREFYRSCASVQGVFEVIKPINQYNFGRRTLDQEGIGNYNEWTASVDEAVEKGFPVVFYGHAYQDNWYDTKYDDDGEEDEGGEYGWEKIVKLIDYVQAKAGYDDLLSESSVIITTIDEMIDIHGNAIDVGTEKHSKTSAVTTPFYRVAKTGETASFLSKELDDLNSTSTLTVFGRYTTFAHPTGTNSVAVGRDAGGDSDADNTTFIGFYAGRSNVGDRATIIGSLAGQDNNGTDVTSVGYQAGRNNTANNLVAVGATAGFNNIGNAVVGVGQRAAEDNEGANVCFIGSLSGQGNTGGNSVGLGRETLRNNTGVDAVAVGYQSGDGAGGANGVYVGRRAGRGNTANNCVFLGRDAGLDNTTGNRLSIRQEPISANPIIEGDFQYGGIALGAPASGNKLADARIGANRFTFFLNEGDDKLMVRVKYADGTTIKEGEVNLT